MLSCVIQDMSLFYQKKSPTDINSSQYIKLQIQYGTDHYELLVSSKENKIQVTHVLDAIEKLTKVPKYHQTIIYKGQRIDNKLTANLDDLFIFNNSKLTLTKRQQSYHNMTTTSLLKVDSTQENEKLTTNSLRVEKTNAIERANKNRDDNLLTKKPTSLTFQKQQDLHTNLTGFIPDTNKSYE